jgi:hypothetical protein
VCGCSSWGSVCTKLLSCGLGSIYFFFETPNYKVQVGKFQSKIDAQKKLRLVIKDFRAAFILKPNTKT